MSRSLHRRWVPALVALALLAGCGGGGDDEASRPLEVIDATTLPPEILGLRVSPEKAAELVGEVEGSYFDAIGLFSFRRGDLLQATLQVSRFNDEADWQEGEFRRSVATQILESGAELPEYRMGDHRIYLQAGARQSVTLWFQGRHLMVLSVRDDFESPRGLVRVLLDEGVVA